MSQDCSDICRWPKVYLSNSAFSCSDYEIVLYDEFSGTDLDSQIWKTYRFNLDHPNARLNHPLEEQLYMEKNVSVDNGKCKLTGNFEPGATWTNNDGETYKRDITSGMIETREVYRYAYYEASIKIPGTGWWPAFWMWHHDEIDIMENFWDDTKFHYNLYGAEGCPETNEFSANINDGNFHTYAVELTPFSLTYYFDGQPLPKKYYRFYSEDGLPLKVSCDNPIIPAGHYYVNPVFPQSRSRGFSPIINLAVLCKYGLGACQSSNPDCVAPYCYECSGSTSCDWGYPFDSNCKQTGEVPATLEVD